MSKIAVRRLSHTIGVFLCLLVLGHSKANGAACNTSGTLADFISLNTGGGCNVGDFNFFRFSFSASGLVNTVPNPSASNVAVDLNFQNGVPVIGFSSSTLFQLSGTASATYRIGYTIDPPPIILGESLEVDPPQGDLRITQDVCLSDVLANGCAFGTALTHFVTPTSPFSFLSFGDGSRFVDYLDTIQLNSTPGNPAGFDAVRSAPSIAPEPGTASMLILGTLVGSGVFVRRFSEWRKRLQAAGR